jgi:bifunctional UDP-N-acetylglucosamine pyrophosphorylase/glucosamine-1-phosphate N-acetyltransferase
MMSSTPRRVAVVLAAGHGKRMASARPKVLHEIGGRSMLAHVLAAVSEAGFGEIAVVVGPDVEGQAVADEARRVAPGSRAVVQTERRGTAHAALQARELMSGADEIVVAFADTPLMRAQTFRAMSDALATGAHVVAVGFETPNPAGYGRLVMSNGALLKIVEHKDADDEERLIRLCNAGVMGFSGAHALELLDAIGDDNAQKEFYLTDAVSNAVDRRLACQALVVGEDEVQGVNDRVQLARAEAVFQDRARHAAMMAGATLIDPATTYFSYDTKLGRDVLVEPGVVFGPGVEVADGATILAYSHLEGALVGPNASVGPFARLRPGATLGAQVKVGNFVEIKNARLGEGAKASHLSYLGDADIGARANIGAGAITCNYDGILKHRTIVGEDAFVGTNASLVAPITIGAGALVAAGSVVTRSVRPDALAITRAPQEDKPGWAAAFRRRQKAEKDRKSKT